MMSNLNGHSGGPQLVWVIEPETKIRFRYESEGGSHGGLAGKAGKKTYPTLQLVNYHGRKQICVRVRLYTEDKKDHVLEFKGKKCEGSKRYIEEELQDDRKVVFKNLQILSKRKIEIEEILMERKLSNLKTDMSRVVRAQFVKRYSKEVKDRAKSILNSVRLHFEAYEIDKPNVRLCTLFSEVICNQKAASKGDLRICRLSQASGSWRGGDEVILLCEKVQKDNIKVRFYETDENDTVIWQEYGLFSPIDVHYQVAIPFKTPAYRKNVEKKVFICLERNEEMSDPREFTYKPDENSSKKRKLDTQQSQAVLFPDNIDSSESISSMSVSSPESSNNANSGEILEIFCNLSPNDDSNLFKLNDEELFLNEDVIDQCVDYFNNVVMECDNLGTSSEVYNLPFEGLSDSTDQDYGFGGISLFKDQTLDIHTDGSIASVKMGDEVDGTKISVNRDVITNQNLNFVDINVGLKNLTLKDECDKYPKKEHSVNASSNGHKERECLRFLKKRDSCGNTILHLAVHLNKNIAPILKISLAVKIMNELLNSRNLRNQTALHLAVQKNKRDAVKVLLLHGSNPNLKDCNGNNCYHIAAKNNLPDILLEINKHSQFLYENDFNDEGLTPMHVAIMQKNPYLFQLLKTHMSNANVMDKKAGKSLLHYAVDFQPLILSELLEMADIDVNIQDFDGNTPLHIACSREDIAAVKKLILHGANPLVKNFKKSFNSLDLEMSEDAYDGELPSDLTANIEILLMLKKAESALNLQNPDTLQRSDEITEKLCKYLDEDMKWVKISTFFVDQDFLESLSLSPSPTKALLDYIKKEEQDNYKEKLKTALEYADLRDAVCIMTE